MLGWIPYGLAPTEVIPEVKAEPGGNFTLPCHIPIDASVALLEWSRTDLEDPLLYFRDNRLYEQYQDPRYRGRVELKDPEMKNGNISVLLKSLNTDDTGTYQCLVVPSNNNRRKRVAVELVSSIRLKVLRNNQGVPEAEMTRRGYDSWH
ncbi:coxsackievirus and adenovirus receptor homolog isoform X2 [Eleginops maclovinus]|uniref:coxsackievirus and adenovirus receptor homolog isoform X2 n=1 Tax=Eleginops maclovinus TaxID=56733 RepID=UPI0030803912